MIVENGKYYLYRHIREDKDEPFYIGIGTKKRGNTDIQVYIRAYSRYDRNEIWKRIVNKSSYKVEIILESNSKSFIKSKEIEFIGLYGRIDLKTGILSNMTNGGDGSSQKSKESYEAELNTRKKNGSYYRSLDRFRKWVNETVKGKDNIYVSKKAYIYDLSGKFISEFRTMTLCANYVGITRSLVCKYCRDKISHSSYMFSDVFWGYNVNPSRFKLINWTHKRKLVKFSRNWEMLEIYKNTKIAGIINGFDHRNLSFIINRKIKYRQHNWRFINNGNSNNL